MTAPHDYLTVVGVVGSKVLTHAVENATTIVVAPDYVLVPEPVEVPALLIEWTERIGTIVHHGVAVHVYYVGEEFTDFVVAQFRRQGIDL